ncbi:MAG: Hint domain-containing protein [Cypionkella sp.]
MSITFTPNLSTLQALAPASACPGLAEGTLLLTQNGAQAVETLKPGDKVITRDHGLQPLRWLGSSEVAQEQPVHFEAGALGAHESITLSAQSRVLIRHRLAKALFDEAEVFAFAADLVNGSTIRRLPDAAGLRMYHLLFDHHEILRAAEMEVESLHPDRSLMRQLDAATQAAILRLLPNTDALMGYGYGPTARICLRRAEARLICGGNR